MSEFELISKLTRALPANENMVVGCGDDCAVLDIGVPDKFVLFKTDAIVEGIHFTADTAPEKIGRKALARCLSDIAAMAGTPNAAVITLGLPKNFDAAFITRIYDGLNDLAKKSGVAVVGGETTENPERIFISVALLGTVARGKEAAFRSQGRRRHFCDRRTRRLDFGKAFGVRTADGRGAMAGRKFPHPRDD